MNKQLPPNFSITETVKETLTRYGKTLGETHIVFAKVHINGINISNESNVEVTIHQTNLEHNTLDIVCPPEAFQGRYEKPLKNAENLLYSTVTVQMIQFGLPAAIYTGRVVSIRHNCHNGANCVIISAKSPTVLMDGEAKTRSFANMTLEDIFKKVTDEYNTDELTVDLKPFFKQKIPFTVQNETDYQFLKRLAIRYGEWIEFTGVKFNLGGLGSKVVEMVQNRDFYDYNINMEAIPQNFSLSGYDNKTANTHVVDSGKINTPSVANPYQQQAMTAANKMFPQSPVESYHESLLEGGDIELEGLVERYKKAKESSAVYLTASSHNPELRLGDVVKMKVTLPGNPLFENYPIESYRITDITHIHNHADGYTNHFTAVPCEREVPAYMNYKAIPQCIEQSAIVVDNNDPLKINRVRVRFSWQQPDEMTPWIEVAQAHSGAGKGCHWIPEKNDHVMVGFKGGNGEVPYVIHSLYNGQQQSGYHTADNNLKVTKTRSGHTIILDDTKDKLSITITDINKNVIYFDTMAKSITISAPETIKILCKNLEIEVEEDITTNVGRDVLTSIGNNKAETIINHSSSQCHSRDVSVTQNKNETVGNEYRHSAGESHIQSVNGDMNIRGNILAVVQGGEDVKLSKG